MSDYDLGAIVLAAIKARHLTQCEAARLCGMTTGQLNDIIRNRKRPQVSTLLRIAEALKCDLEISFKPKK